MKILVLDHFFHKYTGSFGFFVRLLKENFESVDIEYIDSETLPDSKALRGQRTHDLIILLQLDYLAPLFLAAGYRTVVVPMYDGSANMPYEHWIGMKGASFVNFSRTLHERVMAAGCRSLLVKYYLPPVKEGQLPTFENLRGFLWMRRPQDGLTPQFIQRVLGGQLSVLHVHNAPDDQQPRPLQSNQYAVSAFPITESRWSRDNNDYLKALAKCNVFFAPRMSEGIGMAMLEAFSRGQLVIANDLAVHNEYISNFLNGILFNRDSVGRTTLPLNVARDIAFCGWCGAVSGYQEWLDTRKHICEYIKDTPEPASVIGSISPAFISALWDAYVLGGESYKRFLRENVVDWGNCEVAGPLRTALGVETQDPPSLDEEGLFFGMTPKSVGKKFGLKEFDLFSAMLAADTMGFSVKLSRHSNRSRDAHIVLDCDLLHEPRDGWFVLVHVDRNIRARLSLPASPGEFEIRIPLSGGREKDLDVMLSFSNLSNSANIGSTNHPADLPKIKFASARLE